MLEQKSGPDRSWQDGPNRQHIYNSHLKAISFQYASVFNEINYLYTCKNWHPFPNENTPIKMDFVLYWNQKKSL